MYFYEKYLQNWFYLETNGNNPATNFCLLSRQIIIKIFD
jgi:hypothetical protein